jgi:chitin disaccharide deacetylase
MKPNPVLKKLGLQNTDRVVIIHTDDIGMCQASVSAFEEMWPAGIISSGAIMVPCPWFLAAAQLASAHPEMDLGIHLTLTSEWKTCRWGPVSTRDPQSGMLDPQGYFYATTPDAQANGQPLAVQTELLEQIKRGMEAGIIPTHIDTHMGSVACEKFMASYVQLGTQFHLPTMMFRMDEAGWKASGLDSETSRQAAGLVSQLEEMGLPLLDNITSMPLDNPEHRLETAQELLSQLPAGITHFILHPSKDTPELRSITHDWDCRVADYETFQDERLKKYINEKGIHVIGYGELKKLIQ